MDNNSDGHIHNTTQPINRMERLTHRQRESLKSHWMTTVDDFVGTVGTEEGRTGLCRVLNIDLEMLDNLLRDAQDLLGEKRYQELMKAIPGGPTGALWDEKDPRYGDNGSDDEGRNI